MDDFVASEISVIFI